MQEQDEFLDPGQSPVVKKPYSPASTWDEVKNRRDLLCTNYQNPIPSALQAVTYVVDVTKFGAKLLLVIIMDWKNKKFRGVQIKQPRIL